MGLEAEKSVLILGLGNLLLGDEGVGVHVAKRLQQIELPPEVEVIDGGTGGFELIEHVRGKSKVVIVDCLRADSEPGTIVRLSLDQLSIERQIPLSAHQGGVWELLAFIKTLTPAPEVVVYGIVPVAADRLGVNLSPAVESRLPGITSAVIGELKEPAVRTS